MQNNTFYTKQIITPRVSIIILNWNGLKDTLECLESLKKITYQNYEVLVVDNGSKGNDISMLEKKFSRYIRMIKNDENFGFAEGNNTGIRQVLKEAKSDYILLLNNDTVVNINFLDELVKVIENNERIGSVQSVLLKFDGEKIDSLGQELLQWGAKDKGMDLTTKEYFPIQNLEIFGSCAACALYRRKIFTDCGLFDKNFFVIFEDLDLSWRLRLNGYSSILSSRSIVYHKRGVSGNFIKKNSLQKYYAIKNWMIIVLKYYPASFLFSTLVKSPQKIFCSLAALFFYSIKSKRVKESFSQIKKSWEIRKQIQKNSIINQLIKQWVK